MRPHGIKPCNIFGWVQLQGCMCLHTQSPKIPKPVIRAAKLTAVLATAIYKVTGSRVQSLQCVCKCVFWHKMNSVKKTLHACMCVSVWVCACVLYLAALNSLAICSPNHACEVIQLKTEPKCVCIYCISEWEGIGRIFLADCNATLVSQLHCCSPSVCVCLILAGQRVNSLRMALKGRRAVDYMHIHPHPKRSNLSLPTWSMLGSLWYILCWYSLFFVYVNWVFIHLWPVFVTLSLCVGVWARMHARCTRISAAQKIEIHGQRTFMKIFLYVCLCEKCYVWETA